MFRLSPSPRLQRFTKLHALALAMVIGLAACLPQVPSIKPDSDPTRQAQQDAAAGRYARAARTWEQQAKTATGAQRDAYLLDASRAWFNDGQAMKGLAVLRKVRGELPANDPVVAMLLATDQLVANKPGDALRRLDTIKARIDPTYQPVYLELRARAYAMSGNAEDLVAALITRETWLQGEEDLHQNRQLMWRVLRELGRKGHPLQPMPASDPAVAGWLDLARLYRDYRRNPTGLRQQVAGWREAYPRHMAIGISRELFGPSGETLEYPDNVALLLPLTGRFSSAGIAIRDGFLTAYMNDNDNDQRPALRIYDSADAETEDLFAEAVAGGAQFVVGPLVKSNVEKLARGDASGATILALNYLPDDLPAPANLIQFSLAPEHEAAAAARRALSEGLTRAVALVPETDWGSRVLNSFAAAFEQGGGTLIDQQGYNPTEKDFRQPITQLLNLNSSKARHRMINAIVGETLEFEPRRRQDVQLIFLAANADEGRLLRPQLNYHYANDLPVYSTSAIFDNDVARNRKDLEGVVFADAPWMISDDAQIVAERQLLIQYWPNRMKRRARLYAMGIDAYQLIPMINAQRRPLETAWPGMTGMLTMEPGNRIVRGLEAARIHNGAAEYLPPLEDFIDIADAAGNGISGNNTTAPSDDSTAVLPGLRP